MVAQNTIFARLSLLVSTMIFFIVACSQRVESPRENADSPVQVPKSAYEIALQDYRDKKLQEALATLDGAISKGLLEPEAFNLRGLIRQQRDDQDGAIVDFTRAIEMDPVNAESYNNRGLSHQVKTNYANAEADLRKAIQINPAFATAHYNLGILLYTQRRYAEAAQSLTQATKFNPDDSDTWFQLGLTYDRLHDSEQALVAFNRVVQIEQGFDDQVYFLRGLVFYEQQKWPQAYADFDEAIRKGLKNRNTLFYRGVVRYHQGQLEAAVQDLTTALQYDPKFAEAYYYRSFVYARLGNQAKAREDAQKAIELDPPSESTDSTP